MITPGDESDHRISVAERDAASQQSRFRPACLQSAISLAEAAAPPAVGGPVTTAALREFVGQPVKLEFPRSLDGTAIPHRGTLRGLHRRRLPPRRRGPQRQQRAARYLSRGADVRSPQGRSGSSAATAGAPPVARHPAWPAGRHRPGGQRTPQVRPARPVRRDVLASLPRLTDDVRRRRPGPHGDAKEKHGLVRTVLRQP